jgi:hypothetical protein
MSRVDFLCRIIMLNHGTLPAHMPMITAAHVCTSPVRNYMSKNNVLVIHFFQINFLSMSATINKNTTH